MNYDILYNLYLPAFIIINTINLFAFILSYYLFKFKILGNFHPKQKKEHFSDFLLYIFLVVYSYKIL